MAYLATCAPQQTYKEIELSYQTLNSKLNTDEYLKLKKLLISLFFLWLTDITADGY